MTTTLDELAALLEGVEATVLQFDGLEDGDDLADCVIAPQPCVAPRTTTIAAAQRPVGAPLDAAIPSEKPKTPASTLIAKRRYREKRKNELHDLRAASEGLTARLQALADKQNRCSHTLNGSQVWKRIARQRMEERLESEVWNRRLRAQVRSHQELVQRLQRALATKLIVDDADHDGLPPSSHYIKPRVQVTDRDRHFVSTFWSEAELMYSQVNSPLNVFGLPLLPSETYRFRQSRQFDQDMSRQYLDISEAVVIPFDLEDTVRAFPAASQWLVRQECIPAILPVPDPESMIAIKFRFCRGGAEYCQSFATKTFMEGDRAVMVWQGFTEQLDTQDKYIEFGWGFARRISRSGTNVTLIQFCTRLRPLSGTTGSVPWTGCTPAADDYYCEYDRYSQTDMQRFTQAVENAVMDKRVAMRAQ